MGVIEDITFYLANFQKLSSQIHMQNLFYLLSSAGDPDPDPQDLHVLGPPVPVSQRYGFGSGPFPFLIKVLSGLK